APAIVIRRAEDQPSARLEYPLELGKDPLVGGHVLDDFGTDHAIEGAVLEGKLEDRTMHDRIAVSPRITQLGEHDVKRDHPARADDAARAAANVEHTLRAHRHGR